MKIRDSAVVLALFLEQKCMLRQVEQITEVDLWESYEAWCRSRKERPVRREHFRKSIKDTFKKSIRELWINNVRYYLGIGLMP
jgi:hypothetical protein